MEGYVIVTIANEGRTVHAFGADDGQPFDTRAKAQGFIRRYKREEAERGLAPVVAHTCKIIKADADQEG